MLVVPPLVAPTRGRVVLLFWLVAPFTRVARRQRYSTQISQEYEQYPTQRQGPATGWGSPNCSRAAPYSSGARCSHTRMKTPCPRNRAHAAAAEARVPVHSSSIHPAWSHIRRQARQRRRRGVGWHHAVASVRGGRGDGCGRHEAFEWRGDEVGTCLRL